jgi:AcrR family transcriptional regulator
MAEKRQAILTGGLTVFARDGYNRASVDAIATEAGVSTRTIYNHFHDKAELFQTVIQESAARVAESQITLIDRHFHKITDLEADLIAFGLDLVAPTTAHQREHFALVRQINADAEHIPAAAIEAWQQTGPRRVQQALAGQLAKLADRGLLRADDPDRTALHLMLLVSMANPSFRAAPFVAEEAEDMVIAGVQAFLYGYTR